MEFLIRRADEKDVPGIMKHMEEARLDPQHPDWFVAGDKEYIKQYLQRDGFVLVAQAADGHIAGFFVVAYPQEEENLGHYLGFKKEQLAHVAVMDTAVVGSAYRGYGLQGKMLEKAESMIDRDKFYYLMCTVHPDNRFSRHNMETHGYEVKATVRCYGGLLRYVLLKNIKN